MIASYMEQNIESKSRHGTGYTASDYYDNDLNNAK